MTDNIVKEMLKKISRRAKAWEQRYKGQRKSEFNPYTQFGLLDKDMNPKNIDELKNEYSNKYNYKIGILKNISQTDYIKTRDAQFIENLKEMALQTENEELYEKLENQSQEKTMIEYYNGKFDGLLTFYDSAQIREAKAIEKATSKLDLINNRPLN